VRLNSAAALAGWLPQRFLSAHSSIHNHFQLRRHRLTADQHRAARDHAFRIWREVVGVAFAA